METKADIIKLAAVIIDQSGRFLIARDKGENFWKNVGGTQTANESHEEFLIDTIYYELGLKINNDPIHYFDCPITPAVGDPGKTVQIVLYRVRLEDIESLQFKLAGDVEEIHWLTKSEWEQNLLNITPQLKEIIVPKLIEDGFLK